MAAEPSKEALRFRRARAHHIVKRDPSISVEALVERLGVDERSAFRWRNEALATRKEHRRGRRAVLRPRRLP